MNRESAEKAARELRIKIHNLNGKGDECMSPTNEANAKWLDFVVKEDADIIERAGGQDATAQGPWTIRKDADFSGSADYPWMVVSNAPHGPCDANVLCSRMSEENARMVVKALTSACGETAWVSAKHFAENTPEFWTVAVYLGREAPHCAWMCEFAEAYAKHVAAIPSPPTAEEKN